MGQALYRKWRPQTFDDVVGQEHIVRTLRNAFQTGHIHHAYLFAGPRGTGKTTCARLVAKAVNCLAPAETRPCNECEICKAVNAGRLMDLIEIDAASNTGVENVRELLEKVGFRPTQARYKVYVIDEVHMLSTAAFNALLKTLEEPPAHVIFVLATTEVHKILPTVLSRCQRFEFRRIPLETLTARLRVIAQNEGIEAEPEALDLIARAAAGGMRDGISLLDQMAADGVVTADYVRLMLGAERREVVQALARAWLQADLTDGLATINHAVDGGADPRQLARQLADFLRGLLLMRIGAGAMWPDPTTEERPQLEALARQAEIDRLTAAVRLFSQVANESRAGWQPQLPLELAFVTAAHKPEPVFTPPPAAPQATPPTENTTQDRTAARTRMRRAAQESAPSESPPAAGASADVNKPAATPGAVISADAVKARWREVLKRLNSLMAAPFNSAIPLGVDANGILVLGARHIFSRDKANEESYRQAIEEVLSAMFDTPIHVRCVLEKEWASTKQSAPAVANAAAPAAVPTVAPKQPPAAGAKSQPARAQPVTTTPPLPEEPPDDDFIKRVVEDFGAVVAED